ncbi:MAG: hypothetical protein N3A58_06940 [Spirochaetes bacterium]|nr:hypothetical protein [Spirochaetota bacterium]
MKKNLFYCIFFILFLLISSSFVALAQTNTEKFFDSYYQNGQMSIYASVGWWWGLTFSGEIEIILGEWNIADFMPIDFGISGKTIFETWSWFGYSETYIGLAPLFMMHTGIADIGIDYYIGLGVGFAIYKSSDNYYYFSTRKPFEIGIATTSGVIYYLSKNFGLILEYSYIGWVSIWGIGIQLKL